MEGTVQQFRRNCSTSEGGLQKNGTTFPSMEGKQRFEHRVEMPHVQSLSLALHSGVKYPSLVTSSEAKQTFFALLANIKPMTTIDPPDSAFPRGQETFDPRPS